MPRRAVILSVLWLLPLAGGYLCLDAVGRHGLRLHSAPQDLSRQDTHAHPLPLTPVLAVFGALPLVYSGLIDPYIHTQTLDTPHLLLFLACRRLYLYSIAGLALDYSSRRAVEAYQSDLGARFLSINRRILGVDLANDAGRAASELGLTKSLADAPEASQALLLPLLVGSALLVSYSLVSSSQGTISSDQSSVAWLSSILPLVVLLPVLGVCFSFCRAEAETVTGNPRVDSSYSPTVATLTDLQAASLIAAALTAGAFILPISFAWPFQNLVNLAVVSVVAQLVQFSELTTVLLALAGLTLYDFFAVYGSVHAVESVSVMETVARSRLSTSSGTLTWLPGLLEVVAKGRVTDGLGVGDVVFPSMLSGWALRYDRNSTSVNNSHVNGSSMYASVFGGYVLGSLLCEVFQTGGGLPALLFLSPSMLVGAGLGKLREIFFTKNDLPTKL